MREQHLSDEAIAAFADDVLTGHARERARRHTTTCAECNYAVAEQRAAIWALRSAAAPSLPTGLLDRLREVPATTTIRRVPTVVDEKGTAMFAAFGAPAAALVATKRGRSGAVPSDARARSRRVRPLAMTAASFAVVGALAGTSVAADSGPGDETGTTHPVSVHLPAAGTVPQGPAQVSFLKAPTPAQ